MKMLIPQENIPNRPRKLFLLKLFGALVINSVVAFVILADIVVWIYQAINFTVSDIPKIERKKYVVMTRHKLKGLNIVQRWSCWYCEYTNGVIAWMKAVANQTEIYSCAIKYSHGYEGQGYQENFYPQKGFEGDNKG